MTNCAPSNQAEQVVDVEPPNNNNSNNNNDGAVPSTSRAEGSEVGQGDNVGKPKTGRKKTQVVEDYCERILSMSEKDDDPVDLKLAALCTQIKRKLPDADERDDLIFELEQVARQFFRAKKTRAEETVVPVPACEVVVIRPPPPLQAPPALRSMPQIQSDANGGIIEMPVGAHVTVQMTCTD